MTTRRRTPKRRKHNRRHELLIAFCDLLLTEGDRAATLDAVAKRAGVSKGGLLYHFPSQLALRQGLANLYLHDVDDEINEVRGQGESVALWYVRTSAAYTDELERMTNALVSIASTSPDIVREALRRGRERWAQVIRDEVGNDLAILVIQLGDGISYNSQIDGAAEGRGQSTEFAESKGAEQLIKRMLAAGHDELERDEPAPAE